MLNIFNIDTDYVGFIKKIMKLMQHKYLSIKKLEVELKQLEEPIILPTRPCKYHSINLYHLKYICITMSQHVQTL